MAWPELPDPDKPALTPREEKRWNGLNEKSRQDVEYVRNFNKRGKDSDLEITDEGYPTGDFWGAESRGVFD